MFIDHVSTNYTCVMISKDLILSGFFRDMALGGPYYSEFLLMSIYALAARHADESDSSFLHLARGEGCLERAKALLVKEFSQPKPKIPTIQGLLILGGRQCAIGNSSEGWLYTGMVSSANLSRNIR